MIKSMFKFFSQIGVFLLITLFVSCQQDTSQLIIVKNQHSDFQIAYSDSDGSVQEVAAELQQYLKESTGVKLPVLQAEEATDVPSIFLQIPDTATQSSPLQSGWIRLYSKEGNLHLEGNDAEYLFYAMYEFLEKQVGCRWLDPETDFVPKLENLSIPADLDYFYQPDIATRTVHSRLFYENPNFARKQRVTVESFPYYVPGGRVHTFHRFLPEAKYLRQHPEYFALRNGRRLPTQLCLTNEEVFRIVVDSVRAHFERHPEAKVISVSQDDNQQYCTCANCAAIDAEEGSPSGTMIRFVNRVAEQFPEKTISTLAYQYTRSASKTKPRENVLITLCSIECDRSGSITEKCTAFADDLQAWRAMDAKLRIWDYTTQFTNFLAPFPNLRTLQPNIQLFRNSGARWIFEQHSHHPSELFELRSYLTAKLLWNPEEDVDALLQDFTQHYYQEAAPFVLQYVQTIHDELEKDPDFFLFLYGDPSQAFESYLRPEMLLKYQAWFDSAEAKVEGDNILLNRVRRARLSTDYAYLEASRRNMGPGLQMVATNADGNKEIVPELKERLNQFTKTCKNNDITLMNEMRYTVEEYINFSKASMERAQLKNLADGKKISLATKPKKYAKEDPQALTDGAFGGSNFYANWLGFEGNDMIAELDLGATQSISFSGLAFLQVVNHLVFLPEKVTYYYAGADRQFKKLGTIANPRPLTRSSKINDIANFDLNFAPVEARYLKVHAHNMKTPPYWHHGAGLGAWIFADEWVVN